MPTFPAVPENVGPGRYDPCMNPIMELTSRIAGKNAKVRLYPDRIEWERVGMSGGAKAALGVATLGVSLAATGISQNRETEMVPLRSVSHVATKRDGLSNTKVTLTTGGGDVELRCGHADAKAFVDHVNRLLLG